MRPTFTGFETAKKGLSASQKGIDITGQNMTNVNTAGYTRQRIDFVSISISGGGNRYRSSNVPLAGQGVQMQGVSQIRNQFLDKRFRDEFGDVGYFDQTTAILSDVQDALDEITSTGMKTSLEKFFKAISGLAGSPDRVENANIFLSSAVNLTQVLKQFDDKLNKVIEQQHFDLDIAVKDVNSIMEKIADLNRTISEDVSFTSSNGGNGKYGPNELLDQRNLLIDELSRYGSVRTTTNMNGTVDIEFNGNENAVKGSKFDSLSLVANDDQTAVIKWNGNGEDMVSTKGSLKGFTDMINGKGQYASEGLSKNFNFAQGIPYYKKTIDQFAQTFVKMFNGVIPATNANGELIDTSGAITGTDGNLKDAAGNVIATKDGNKIFIVGLNRSGTIQPNGSITLDSKGTITSTDPDLNGAVIDGKEFRLPSTLPTDPADGVVSFNKDGSGTVKDSLGNVLYNIDADGNFKSKDNKTILGSFEREAVWNISPNNTVTDGGGNVLGTFELNLAYKDLFDPNNVNAGNITINPDWIKDPSFVLTKLASDGTFNNKYFNQMITIFNDKNTDFGQFTGNFEQYINFYNTNLGQQIDFNKGRTDTVAGIADDLLNRRDAVSGVNPDEEATNLLMFDKSYKACARLMTTLDEALDTLINRTGRVGI